MHQGAMFSLCMLMGGWSISWNSGNKRAKSRKGGGDLGGWDRKCSRVLILN